MRTSPTSATFYGVFIASALVLAPGCDEPKKEAPKPTSSATATTLASTEPVPTVAPTASATAKPKKAARVCPEGPNLKTDDAVMEAQLRIKLGKKPGEVIKLSELPNVKSLNLTEEKSIDELDPCIFPKLIGLKFLYLGKGDYDDLTPIAGLTQLETLRASISKVSDLRPLEKMVKLDQLDLGRTQVRDLSVLANFKNLTELQLDETPIADLAPLAECKKLKKVSIKSTAVSDLSPLRGATDLKFLYIGGSAVKDTSALGGLVSRGLKISSE
ncbi:MAG: leucine-rich repeat domain-containing protein [Polyangiaceae bacterium]